MQQSGANFFSQKSKDTPELIDLIDLIFAIGMFLVFLYFCYGSCCQRCITSGSMQPSYDFPAKIHVNPWYYNKHDPKVGDVVTFYTCSRGHIRHYTKRIMGCPGDTLLCSNGMLWLNGERISQYYPLTDDELQNLRQILWEDSVIVLEKIPRTGTSFPVVHDRSSLSQNWKFIVPQDQYFVLGDHRCRSGDTRNDLSFIHKKYLSGKVLEDFSKPIAYWSKKDNVVRVRKA